jgi:DNA-binding response OmpR family regulator
VTCPLTIDRGRHLACWCDKPIPPSNQQFRMLWKLADADGRVVSVGDLARALYGTAGPIGRVRRILGDDPSSPQLLVAVRGEGYRLVLPVDSHSSVSF